MAGPTKITSSGMRQGIVLYIGTSMLEGYAAISLQYKRQYSYFCDFEHFKFGIHIFQAHKNTGYPVFSGFLLLFFLVNYP
jgi:hypothetical protein